MVERVLQVLFKVKKRKGNAVWQSPAKLIPKNTEEKIVWHTPAKTTRDLVFLTPKLRKKHILKECPADTWAP